MSLTEALQALKNRDFAAARALIAHEKAASFTLQHYLIKGLAESALLDWTAAWATFTEATARFPGEGMLWLNRGIAEENLGEFDAAIASQEYCLSLLPSQAEAAGNLSNLYRKQRNFAGAEQMARRAVAGGAAKGEALNSLGLALGKRGKFAEAEAALREAQANAPDDPDILANRANLAVDQLRFAEAWDLFAAARKIEDKAVFRRDEGMARMLAGDYACGWPLYEARLEMPQALRLYPDCPAWRGENMTGRKLLILAEQGFGDVIQFCRYQKFLPDCELVWAVPVPLVRLLSGTLRGTVISETAPPTACDYYAPIMSLPLLTGHVQPETASACLTTADEPKLPQGKQQKKIGLVWAGSKTHEHNHERSLKLKQLAPLFTVAADFYAPFIGDALDEIGNYPVTRLDHLIKDFADTAALLKQLDVLITVDTAVAHLAGALGVKTYLLLAHCPDWRWGTMGETTPWHPSLTVLRQPRYGDWAGVIKELLERGF